MGEAGEGKVENSAKVCRTGSRENIKWVQQWMEEKEEGVRTLVGRTLMRGLQGKEGD